MSYSIKGYRGVGGFWDWIGGGDAPDSGGDGGSGYAPPAAACKAHAHADGQNCTCDAGYILVGTDCVAPAAGGGCPQGTQPDAYIPGNCVPTSNQCGNNTDWDQVKDICACKAGYVQASPGSPDCALAATGGGGGGGGSPVAVPPHHKVETPVPASAVQASMLGKAAPFIIAGLVGVGLLAAFAGKASEKKYKANRRRRQRFQPNGCR